MSEHTISVEVSSQEELTDIGAMADALGYASASEYLLDLHRRKSKQGSHRDIKADSGDPLEAPKKVFSTKLGDIYLGDSAILLTESLLPQSVDLIMTSPPFGLIKKKVYGNEDADEYLDWFGQFAERFRRVLKPNGSLVIDIGGAWEKGQPTRSLYHFELMIMLCREFDFHLAQEFYWWNPSKLPTPAEWVTIRRIRVKDAVNTIWWLSPTPYPKATNWRVIQPYSKSMKHLLENGYQAKKRPSGHDISNKFRKDNKGAIPPNLIALANTRSTGPYKRYCREHDLPEHPARFPKGIPAFFIRMLTDPGDLVLDPFAGSCITGEVAERMERRWICCEIEQPYVEGAKGRFLNTEEDSLRAVGRRKPYEVYPPVLDLLPEENVPFPEDYGRTRPSKNNIAEDNDGSAAQS